MGSGDNKYHNAVLEFGNYLNKTALSELSEKKIGLVLGAGVTQCLVGSWNELLNEVMVERCSRRQFSTQRKDLPEVEHDSEKYRKYINNKIKGRTFLSEGIDVREKGEYLRYDYEDFIEGEGKKIKEGQHSEDLWREKTFAARVRTAMLILTDRHLCDGASEHRKKDIIEDFIEWKEKKEIILNITRRDVTESGKCKKKLKKYDIKTVYNEINKSYFEAGTAKNIRGLIRLFNKAVKDNQIKETELIEREYVKKIWDYFPFRVCKKSSSEFYPIQDFVKEKIINALNRAFRKEDTTDEIVRDMILDIAVFALWRPDYSTLDALLELCYTKTNDITNIITYNFDVYFEELLTNKKIQEIFERKLKKKNKKFRRVQTRIYNCAGSDYSPAVIDRFNDQIDTQERKTAEYLSVYHVHGIIDKDLDISPIIFSGTSYTEYGRYYLNRGAREFAEVYDRSDILLCVGFSGSDANFRKMASQLKKLKDSPVFGGSNHRRIILTRAWKNEAERYGFYDGNSSEEEQKLAYGCLESFMSMAHYYYKKEFDVNTYWFEDYSKMAAGIKKIGVKGT